MFFTCDTKAAWQPSREPFVHFCTDKRVQIKAAENEHERVSLAHIISFASIQMISKERLLKYVYDAREKRNMSFR